VLDIPEPGEMRRVRAAHQEEWFFHWRGGKAYALPRIPAPATLVGEELQLECANHDNLHILTSRLNDALPDRFPSYEAFRRRPFAFLGRKDEIVGAVTGKSSGLSPLVSLFKIRPRFELDPRLVELRNGQTFIGLFMNVGMHWNVIAPLNDLQHAGIDLAGLHVVRRNPTPEERHLVGKIASVSQDTVYLAEAYDDLESISVNQVWLEGSRTSFSRCLRKLLGARFADFENQRYAKEGEFLLGPSLDRLLSKMEDMLRQASPVTLTPDLTCTIGERLELFNDDEYKSLIASNPVEYCFDAAKSKRSILPWAGLLRYGPYSRDTFSKRTPRILVVTPDQAAGKVSQFVKVFRDGIQSFADSRYPKGFAGTFGLVNPEFITCTVPLLEGGSKPTAELYRRAVEDHVAAQRDAYDAALIAILDEHAGLPDSVNPYLHGKAALLMNGVPVQEARLSTLSASHTVLQWSIQNLAIALYAKMGGIPWTVAHDLAVDDELVIGMGTAELSGSRFESRQRHIGITTVFRGDGNYLLSNVSRVCSYGDYPAVLRESTLDVLREVKSRNGWRVGDTVRVVYHVRKPLKRIEIAAIVNDCVKEVGSEQNIQFAFLTVSQDHPFKVLDSLQKGLTNKRGCKGALAPERGTIAQLGRYTRLLSTNGPHQIKRPTTPLPSPLLVHLHPESTYRDLAYLTEQALKFTSLTWRSTQPAAQPVTIYYSELIAELLARLQTVPGWSPAILNSKLRSSRWFL
jgi:hypothetical protein